VKSVWGLPLSALIEVKTEGLRLDPEASTLYLPLESRAIGPVQRRQAPATLNSYIG
jgi:hypothetical protein